jgi:hypothetical protein
VKVFSQHLLAVVVLFALTAAVYWRLTPPAPQYVWFDQYDMCQLELPRLQFHAREWNQHRIPLWNPHTWGGQPALGGMQPGPIYPLNVLFFQLPLKDGVIPVGRWNWWFICIHAVAAYFTFLLCRDLRLTRAASVLGGITFSCAGFLGGVPWIDVANGVTWTPIIFLFVLRLLRGHRMVQSAVFLGVAIGISWFSGHHEIPLLNSYAVLISLVAVAVFHRLDRRLLSSTAGAFALALLISAVQMMPAIEFGRYSKRWVGTDDVAGWNDIIPYSVHAQHSLPWSGLRGLFVPGAPETYTGAFVGFTVLALATIALICCWSQRHLRYMIMLCVAGMIFALGVNTPLHWLLYKALPLLDKARTPVRCLYLVTFALSIAAAYGADFLIRRNMRPWYQFVAGGVLLSLAFWEIGFTTARRVTPLKDSACASTLFNLGTVRDRLNGDAAIGRINVNRDQVMTNLGELHGFRQLQGFVPAAAANVLRHELHTPRTQELFGVTHHLGRNAGGVHLTRTPQALPRAWIVHDVVPVDSEGALRVAIQDQTIDLRRSAVMLGTAPALERCEGAERVTEARPDTDNVILDARLACRGLLVLSDTFFPGWEASIDGRPAPIVEAYGAFRAVVVEKGDHRVEMNYRPKTVYWGFGLTMLGIITALSVMIVDERRNA